MWPFDEIVYKPFKIKHATNDINLLIELINSVEGESRIVMEHTGRYYEVLAKKCVHFKNLNNSTTFSLRLALVWWSDYDTHFSTCIKFSIFINLALTFYLQANSTSFHQALS